MHSRLLPAGVVLATAFAAAVAVALAPDDSGVAIEPMRHDALASGELPPDDVSALAAIFDPELEPMGMRLVRGRLQDPPGAYTSLDGRHLAVYIEPLARDHSEGDYARTFVESARVFLPHVFERWPGLVSMDVCQEPPPGVDDRPAPTPVTVLEVERDALGAVEWHDADLDALVDASSRGEIRVVLTGGILATVSG